MFTRSGKTTTNAISCGVLAGNLLHYGGKVVARFASSAYLAADTTLQPNLICVGATCLPSGPINLALDCEQLKGCWFQLGDSWRVDAGRLFCHDVSVAKIAPNQVQVSQDHLSLPTLVSRPPQLIIDSTYHALQHIRPASVNRNFNERFQVGRTSLRGWLTEPKHGGPEACPREDLLSAAASQLIGCGEGLTPAGDDYLVGILIILKALASASPRSHADTAAKTLSQWIEQQAGHRTNAISAAHLHAARQGMAVVFLHQLVNSLVGNSANNAQNVPKVIKKLQLYGHSSGYFAALGVCDGLDVFHIC